MDEEIPSADRAKIEEVLRGAVDRGALMGWHGLRTRTAGRAAFVEVHLEMGGDLALQIAHDRGDAIMAGIREVLPSAQVTVHLDAERDEPTA